ncbi:MAG: hypothetical protein ABR567_16340 [Myxococcales bacterium]|nr:class I SAM-dependent methyltransferase [Myxococcales bacterium]
MRVERLLWDARGNRRVPPVRAFDQAVTELRRGELERICEFNPHGPIYFIPTRPLLRALARKIGRRRVLEVAAGDGHLARELSRQGVKIVATDSGTWERPQARMNAAEKRKHRGRNVPGLRLGANVVRMEALAAIVRFEPEVVLACWLPPGPLLGRLVRAAPRVIEIGAGSGITGDIRCWRYEHEFLDELDALGRCRLDERPARKLHTRVTLYERRPPRRRG